MTQESMKEHFYVNKERKVFENWLMSDFVIPYMGLQLGADGKYERQETQNMWEACKWQKEQDVKIAIYKRLEIVKTLDTSNQAMYEQQYAKSIGAHIVEDAIRNQNDNPK